jgi:hypothetical protein
METMAAPHQMQMLHNPDLIEMLLARVKVRVYAVHSQIEMFFGSRNC